MVALDRWIATEPADVWSAASTLHHTTMSAHVARLAARPATLAATVTTPRWFGLPTFARHLARQYAVCITTRSARAAGWRAVSVVLKGPWAWWRALAVTSHVIEATGTLDEVAAYHAHLEAAIALARRRAR